MNSSRDVGGQRSPGLLYGVCPSKSEIFIGRVFECLDFEFELDFDRQTPHSKSGQNPDSAVRRRLSIIKQNFLEDRSLYSAEQNRTLLF